MPCGNSDSALVVDEQPRTAFVRTFSLSGATLARTMRVMSRPKKQTESRSRTSIRLEPELWARIDRARAVRPGKVSRNTWITEAVREKLGREVANGDRGSDA